jgi:hypothetical protein
VRWLVVDAGAILSVGQGFDTTRSRARLRSHQSLKADFNRQGLNRQFEHCGNASPLTRRALDELYDNGITYVANGQARNVSMGVTHLFTSLTSKWV